MTISPHWSHDAVFYHIYPLGLCGAPARNDFISAPVPRLAQLHDWIPHLRRLGVNALYLGPLFESSAHGYDTANYYEIDRRLGDRATLKALTADLHRNGIRLILDGVFNHVGRDFWAFRDVLQNGPSSPYCAWFDGLRFDARSPYGDPFTYQPWADHYDLVRINPASAGARTHLLEAVRMWVDEFEIDGLRLDVADCLDADFMRALRTFTDRLRPDFWLMGEVVHGDYRHWANPAMLHSVTNYEAYKGLYSSLADRNYFEIAYTLNRQFGPGGLYTGLPLYNFADNHDVDRVASRLPDSGLLFPLYFLLFTMPGVPSIYYGSEFGITGRRTSGSDAALRPALDLDALQQAAPIPGLAGDLARLSAVRQALPALRYGNYTPLHVAAQQLAFLRQWEQDSVVVVLNAAREPVNLDVRVPSEFSAAVDVLNGGERFAVSADRLCVNGLYPGWGRVLRLERS